MKIVVDSDIPFINGIFEPFAEVEYIKGELIDNSDLRDADALVVRTRTRCDERLLRGSKVRFIATATIGYDHIEIDYCLQNGIAVKTSAGCNARAVLQWVSAVLATSSIKEGWHPESKTLGVVGVGNVGSLVCDYAQRWGFKVLYCDPVRQRAEGGDFATLEEIAHRSDIITFHTCLNKTGPDKTLDMAGHDFFSNTKEGTLIINSSRGEVLNDDAFKRAILSRGLIAAIDTWRNEPQIDLKLLELATFASQHIAGYSLQGKAKATAMAVNSLSVFFNIPLSDWYPENIETSAPHHISWDDMRSTINNYIDLPGLTTALKSATGNFEHLRSSYKYRGEYF